MPADQARLRDGFAADAARNQSGGPYVVSGGFGVHPMVRPQAVAARGYQLAIAKRAAQHSTLVVLPTGLGKTVVAALVAAERLRKAGGFVLVLAPTRPLAAQHHATLGRLLADRLACRSFLVTGSTPRPERAAAFAESALVISTPETVESELEQGDLSLARCSLLIVEEAHRAVGNYSYVTVARALRRDRPGGLVLGLTASPGSSRRRVAAIVVALGVKEVEARTRLDPDVAPFVQQLVVEVASVALTPHMVRLQEMLERLLEERVDALVRLGVMARTPVHFVSLRDLLAAGETLRARLARNRGRFFAALSAQAQAMSLAHALTLLETQGCRPLADFLGRLGAGEDASRAVRALAAEEAVRDAHLISRALSELSHPKMGRLAGLVSQALRENASAQILVFAQYRDTVRAIGEYLERPPPGGAGVRRGSLLGQRARAGGAGFSEAQEAEVLSAFRAGRFPVLVATSVSEEGLDIPSVDLVVFFEAVPSEIRAIQRRGRGGRAKGGRVVVLVTTASRDEAALRAEELREKRAAAAVAWVKEGGGRRGLASGTNRTLPVEGGSLP